MIPGDPEITAELRSNWRRSQSSQDLQEGLSGTGSERVVRQGRKRWAERPSGLKLMSAKGAAGPGTLK